MQEPNYLTCAEVAERLRTTPMNVLRMCRANKIPATKPLGRWLIAEADLARYIEASSNTKAAS